MSRVVWNGDALAAAAKQAAIEITQMTAETIKGKAVDLCPYDSSQTRNSGTVNSIKNGAEISFNTPQAAWLHESQNYKPSHPGTGPGYLRQPLLDEESQYLSDMAAAIKAIFG